MRVEYGNDNDNVGNTHNEDVDSTDLKTTWKIQFYFLKWGLTAEEN